MPKKVAFVTGASRGIGKSIAVDLAASGYDVAITARTVEAGEHREHSSTLARSDDSPLPGSLSETAALIRDAGGQALAVPADLLDEASLGSAARVVLERWGGVDVLVHNGRYIGPGHMDRFMDTPMELLRRQMEANVMAPLVLNKLLLPSMIEKGGGSIVNITSASGYADPTEPAGQGGWGMGYGLSKGAFQRVAGFLDIELRDRGIRAYNVQPGLIATERIAQDMAQFGIANVGAPPEVVAKVVTWLLTDPEGPDFSGRNIEAQWFCHDRNLLDGWAGPQQNDNHIRYDESAANLMAYEARWATT
ncbi:MAG: SDR family NAD(P)-dependent oxidoreductase [Actinomycetota bacterium]|nr:SDR family NAD(P)-dependent oxidoreductase [Actinomycetota bacterium]